LGEAGFQHHLLGGEYQPRSKSTAGRFAIENLRQIYADIAIIGVDGISLKHGCTVPVNAEAEVVRQMIERTKGKVIIVADHSKWGIVSNFQIASIDEIDVLVTDARFDSSAIDELVTHSVETLIASANSVKA
jgi:DeoR family fructose operon transcriptional repressor